VIEPDNEYFGGFYAEILQLVWTTARIVNKLLRAAGRVDFVAKGAGLCMAQQCESFEMDTIGIEPHER